MVKANTGQLVARVISRNSARSPIRSDSEIATSRDACCTAVKPLRPSRKKL